MGPDAPTSRKVAGVARKALGVNLAGAAPGADLGGSSKYSRETPGGPMWRRVSCEQLLDTSQSVLRLRGSLGQMRGLSLSNLQKFVSASRFDAERESGPYSGTRPRNCLSPRVCRGDATRPGDAGGSSGKSCLFCVSRRGPGIVSHGEWALVQRRSVPKFSRHPRASCRTLKIPGRARQFRAGPYPYPQQVSEVCSLWSID